MITLSPARYYRLSRYAQGAGERRLAHPGADCRADVLALRCEHYQYW